MCVAPQMVFAEETEQAKEDVARHYSLSEDDGTPMKNHLPITRMESMSFILMKRDMRRSISPNTSQKVLQEMQ